MKHDIEEMRKFMVIVINGPPKCGKDTITKRVVQATTPYTILNHRHIMGWDEKMIMPIRDLVCNLFRMSDYDFETYKDTPILPGGWTPREAVIMLDEFYIRRVFGEDFLGRLMVSDLEKCSRRGTTFFIKNQIDVHFVDAGVEAEVAVLKDAFGEKRVKIVRICRDGTSFTDSRKYLDNPDGVVYNDGTIEEAVDKILLLVNRWLEEFDDKGDARITAGVFEEGESDRPQS